MIVLCVLYFHSTYKLFLAECKKSTDTITTIIRYELSAKIDTSELFQKKILETMNDLFHNVVSQYYCKYVDVKVTMKILVPFNRL